jgi:hypothetical protein
MDLEMDLEMVGYVTPRMNCSKLLAIVNRKLICSAIVAATLIVAPLGATQAPAGTSGEKVNPNAAALKGFQDRVNDYIALQKKAGDGLPKLSGDEDPSKIEAHQAAMAARIKIARANAKPGEIFGDAAPIVKNVVRQDAHLRKLRDARAAMEEVPKFDPPKVNAAYPEKLPLATVPPLVLDALPRLPEGLEYRFMGNDLILRDTKANVIADFVNGAVPAATGK